MPVSRFDDIRYLLAGNARQLAAYNLLLKYDVFGILQPFDPILAGTIPINIDIENSDLDIICCFADKDYFRLKITSAFSEFKNFSLIDTIINQGETIIANFIVESMKDVPPEIMATMPTDGASQHDHYIYGWPKRDV